MCEGGPVTLGQLVADDLLDELCLTMAPTMVAGTGPRIAHGPAPVVGRHHSLARVLADDGNLFLRYVRRPVSRRAQCRLGAVRLVSSVSSRSKSARSSNPL